MCVALSTTWSIVGAISTTDVIDIYGFKLIWESDADFFGNRTEAGKLLSFFKSVQYQGDSKIGKSPNSRKMRLILEFESKRCCYIKK